VVESAHKHQARERGVLGEGEEVDMIKLIANPSEFKVLSFYPDDIEFFLTICKRVQKGYVLIEGFSPYSLSEWIPEISVPLGDTIASEKLTVRNLRYDFTGSVEDFCRIFPKLAKGIESHGIILNIFSRPVPGTLSPRSLINSRSQIKVLCQNGLMAEVVFPHLGEAATIASRDEALLCTIRDDLERREQTIVSTD